MAWRTSSAVPNFFDGTPSTNVYLKVVNKSGSTQAITVTLYYLPLET